MKIPLISGAELVTVPLCHPVRDPKGPIAVLIMLNWRRGSGDQRPNCNEVGKNTYLGEGTCSEQCGICDYSNIQTGHRL